MKKYYVYEKEKFSDGKYSDFRKIAESTSENQAEAICISYRLYNRNNTKYIFFYEEVEEYDY